MIIRARSVLVFDCPKCNHVIDFERVREKHRAAGGKTWFRCVHCRTRHVVMSSSNDTLYLEDKL